MTAEAQRIAIAEGCNWLVTDDGSNNYKIMGSRHGWKQGFKPEPIPDYLNDLNACREFEEKLIALGPPALDTYEIFLLAICTRAGNRIFRATAAQRREAFLKTLDKWKNDN